MLHERSTEKGLYTLWFHLYDILEKTKLKTEKSDQLLLRAEGRGDGMDCKGHWGTSLSLWKWWSDDCIHLSELIKLYT